MRFLKFEFNFLSFILFILFITFSFNSSYSTELDNFSNSEDVTALETVRDGMWDLALKVYLYETVLFEPDKYFNFDESSGEESNISNSINIETSSEGVWTVPVRGELGNNVNFIPAQLFDITFIVSDGDIYELLDVLAVVTFDNFGTEAIPVELTYTLFNSDNEIIFVDSDSEIVESVKSLVRDFKNQDLELLTGSYRLVLETVYGDNVRDSFVSNFSVLEKQSSFFSGWILYLFGFISFVIILFLFLFIYRNYFVKSENIETFDNVKSDVVPINGVSNLNSESVPVVAAAAAAASIPVVSNLVGSSKKNMDSDFSDNLDEEIEGGGLLIEDDF
jgi:hypothetical protein